MNPPVLHLPLDLSGDAVTNRVTAELHPIAATGNRAIVTQRGPFFTKNLVVRNASTGTVLRPDVDYRPVHMFLEASLRATLEICSVVLVLPACSASEIEIDYNAIGGEYSASVSSIEQMIASLDLDSRTIYWGDLIGAPEYFPPTAHLHDIGDLYGFEYVVAALESVRRAILMGDQAAFDELRRYIDLQIQELRSLFTTGLAQIEEHINRTDNPHNTTKAHVGLSLVQNYAVATQSQAEGGTANNVYMTPLRTQQAITAAVGTAFNSHVGNLNNPHQVTKAQVGLGNVENLALASNAQATAGNGQAYMTASLTGAAITALALAPLNAHIGRTDNPHSTTKAQVGLSNVDNYGTATNAQAIAGTATNLFLTPASGKAAMEAFVTPLLDGHANLTNNPHKVNATQVGLGNVSNYATASNAQAITGTATNLFMTPASTKAAMDAVLSSSITAHVNRTDNPHNVTKAQVGLGNVQNYGVATNAQAIAGTATNLYMTPANTKAVLAEIVGDAVGNHVGRTDNPHNVTAAQVGLGNVDNARQVRAGNSHTYTMTWTGSETRLMVDATDMGRIHTTSQPDPNIAAHANRGDNPHNVTAAQIGLGAVNNWGVANQSQAEAGWDHTTYMSPLRTRQAITAQAINPLQAQIDQRVVNNSDAALNTLHLYGAAYFYNSGGGSLGLRVNGNRYYTFESNGNYVVHGGRAIASGGFQPSDRRFKKDVTAIAPRALWRELSFVKYTDLRFGEEARGSIAQEAQVACPDRVTEFDYTIDEERVEKRLAMDYVGIAYENSMAAGVEIDALKAELEEQATQTELLKRELAQMRALVDRLVNSN